MKSLGPAITYVTFLTLWQPLKDRYETRPKMTMAIGLRTNCSSQFDGRLCGTNGT
jgi:hypothetical protein